MRVDVGIIGGTGVGSRLMALPGVSVHVPTPFGIMRCRSVEHGGKTLAIVRRHSIGHSVPPHKVNYRAIAHGLKHLGAEVCFASAAVGGMHKEWPVGSFAVCSDFVDLTARNLTIFDREVCHTDFSYPFDQVARTTLLAAAEEVRAKVYPSAIYVNGNGPRYETPHEITLYRQLGGDVVGMTAATEAIAMGEVGLPYGCLAVVTNFACGILGVPLTHDEVVTEMNRVGETAVEILLRAALAYKKPS